MYNIHENMAETTNNRLDEQQDLLLEIIDEPPEVRVHDLCALADEVTNNETDQGNEEARAMLVEIQVVLEHTLQINNQFLSQSEREKAELHLAKIRTWIAPEGEANYPMIKTPLTELKTEFRRIASISKEKECGEALCKLADHAMGLLPHHKGVMDEEGSIEFLEEIHALLGKVMQEGEGTLPRDIYETFEAHQSLIWHRIDGAKTIQLRIQNRRIAVRDSMNSFTAFERAA